MKKQLQLKLLAYLHCTPRVLMDRILAFFFSLFPILVNLFFCLEILFCTLGLILRHVKLNGFPFSSLLASLIIISYLEESLKFLARHSGYFHEDVRLQAIIALKRE